MALPSALKFRLAQPQDAAAITAFVNATYHGPEAEQGWTTELHLHGGPRTNVQHVRSHIGNPDSYLLLCEDESGLVGCVLLERYYHDTHFGMFAVRPRAQGAGIGKAIIEKAQEVAVEQWRARTMTLSAINLQNELIAFYERRGFRRTGETLPFPFGEAPGAKRTDYHLIVLRKSL